MVHHRGIRQGAGITQVVDLVLGNLAQDTAHDLAGAGLGQPRRPLDHIRLGDGANFLGAQGHQLLAQLLAGFDPIHGRDKAVDALALDVVGIPHDRGLGDIGVQDQCAFDFGGTHAVARNIEHIVHPPGDPVIAVRVAGSAIAGEVVAGIVAEVGVDHTLVITVDGANLAGP